MATAAEQQHAQRLLKIHRRNLERLEEKKAKSGADTDLATENAIDEEKANIAALSPIANPPPKPSPTIEAFVKQTTPSEIDLLMLYLQGTQINARVTKQEEQNIQIIDEQSRARLGRLELKEIVADLVTTFADLVGKVDTSEKRRQRGALVYRVAILLILVWIIVHQFGVW